MYVGQIRWAGVYILVALVLGVAGEFYFHQIAIVTGVMQIFLALTCAVHAYRLAKKYPDERPRPAYSRWYGLLGALLGLVSIAFGVRAFLVEPFRFPSGSMLPTIPLGSHLIAQKWGYGNYGTYGLTLLRTTISSSLRRGDVIIFEFPTDRSIHYAKRLIGLPGDKVAYQHKRLTINGKPAEVSKKEDFLHPGGMYYSKQFVENIGEGEYRILNDETPSFISDASRFLFDENCLYDDAGVVCTVPEGHYFMLGDNRDNSRDSRMWGFVPADHIVGRVLYILP